MFRQRFFQLILLSLLILCIAGCGSDESEPVATAEAEPTAVATDVPPPTSTPPPTITPLPTETPIPPTETPSPTDTPQPTNTPVPTAAMAPEPVNIEEPFRDDFDGAPTEDVGWQWFNEDPDRWSISDEGWLEIQAANPQFGEEMVNLLARPLPSEQDVIVTTLVNANPAENFKQAALYFFDEEWNYVSVLIGFCQPCLPDDGGYGIFVEAFNQGESMLPEPVWLPRAESQSEVYLRLEYSPEAAAVVGLFAYEPDSWEQLFLLRDVPPFYMTGIGAANLPGPEGSSVDLKAEYDYFELEKP